MKGKLISQSERESPIWVNYREPGSHQIGGIFDMSIHAKRLASQTMVYDIGEFNQFRNFM